MHIELQTQLRCLKKPEELAGWLGDIRADSMVFKGVGVEVGGATAAQEQFVAALESVGKTQHKVILYVSLCV
jgi:hypothetical protein